MRRQSFSTIGFVSAMVIVSATMPASALSDAQELRTTEQMEEFIAKASTAADHQALRQHFLDMAAKYEAEAQMHTVMAGSNPRDRGNHDALARQARKAASSASELAELHRRMATGAPASKEDSHASLTMPPAQYPDLLSAEEVRELAANAKTPADHAKLAKHFAAEAARLRGESRLHAAMATGYRTGDQRGNLATASHHCARLVKQTNDAAKAADKLSARHEALASGGATK